MNEKSFITSTEKEIFESVRIYNLAKINQEFCFLNKNLACFHKNLPPVRPIDGQGRTPSAISCQR
jgi:hypothetical protein